VSYDDGSHTRFCVSKQFWKFIELIIDSCYARYLNAFLAVNCESWHNNSTIWFCQDWTTWRSFHL